MDNGEGSAGHWLHDDQRLVVYALVSLALLVGGHRTWQEYNRYHESAIRRARIMKLVESSRREKERLLEVSGLVASRSVGGTGAETVDQAKCAVEVEAEVENSEHYSSQLSQSQQPSAGANKRTKERRKRGRDVTKEVLKQERKRGRAPPRDSSAASTASLAIPGTGKAGSMVSTRAQRQQSPIAGPSSTSSTSCSSSRAPSRMNYDSTEETPRVVQESWTAIIALDDMSSATSQRTLVDAPSHSVEHPSDNGNNAKDPCAVPLPPTPPLDVPEANPFMSNSSESASSRSHSEVSSPTMSILQLSNEGAPSSSSSYMSETIAISQPTPAGPSIKSQASWLDGNDGIDGPNHVRPNQNNRPPSSSASTISLSTSECSADMESPFASALKYAQNKSSPPRFRSKSRASVNSPLPTMSQIYPSNGTPPPAAANASIQAQVASYKGALEAARRREEAARIREEASRREMERFKTECEVLRIRWKEDAERRQAIEAELRAELYFLKSHISAVPSGANPGSPQVPSFLPQAQHNTQAHNRNGAQSVQHPFSMPQVFRFGYPQPISNSSHGFPGPTSPPSHPPFPFPFVASNGFPIMHVVNGVHSSGINSTLQSPNVLSPTHDFANMPIFMNPTPSSVPLSDNVHDPEGPVNENLAEAILKRPDSLRAPSSSLSSRSASVQGRATKDGFTFASLSELGNPQTYRETQRSEDDIDSEFAGVSNEPEAMSGPTSKINIEE